MSLKDEPAFPVASVHPNRPDSIMYMGGLTKREYFAGQLFQGVSTHNGWASNPEHTARAVVAVTDALIKELEK